MTTKLYELPRNSYFFFEKEQYLLHHLDGMYSYCTDTKGIVHHFRADTPVEPLTYADLTDV